MKELNLQAVMGLFCTTDGVFYFIFLKELASFCSLKDTTTGEDLFLNVMETVACLQRDCEKLTTDGVISNVFLQNRCSRTNVPALTFR